MVVFYGQHRAPGALIYSLSLSRLIFFELQPICRLAGQSSDAFPIILRSGRSCDIPLERLFRLNEREMKVGPDI